MEKIIYNSHSYLFTLEDVADHLGSRPYHLGLLAVLRQDPPPGHDDDQLPDVCDVGDGAEGVVHHDLLHRTNHSHWSSSYITVLSLVESYRVLKYFHALKGPIIGGLSVVTPAVLCAIKNQLVAKIPPTRGISCSSLVLYGIRIVGFHARKGPIRGGFMH